MQHSRLRCPACALRPSRSVDCSGRAMLARLGTSEELPDTYQLDRPELAARGLIFGRNAESDIILNTEAIPLLISRKHASLTVVGQTLCIQDSGSTNGTYVNEQRLRSTETKQLANGDVISFGGPKLIFRDGQQHSNPFVYVVSEVESVIAQAEQRLRDSRASVSDPAQASGAVFASAVAAPQPSSTPEQLVDLTRTSSSEAGMSAVVDLTSSPEAHVRNSSRCSYLGVGPSACSLPLAC